VEGVGVKEVFEAANCIAAEMKNGTLPFHDNVNAGFQLRGKKLVV
jgi:hypothetical protein